jgi:hypothetical protein
MSLSIGSSDLVEVMGQVRKRGSFVAGVAMVDAERKNCCVVELLLLLLETLARPTVWLAVETR